MSEPSSPASWRDFNDADDQVSANQNLPGKDELKAKLLDDLTGTLERLFPAGRIDGRSFKVGDVSGNSGESLVVTLSGNKAGLWKDFATGEGGDVIDLFAAAHGLDARHHFSEVMRRLIAWHGDPLPAKPANKAPIRRKSAPPVDTLGPYTAKYDYHDAGGRLIACVYRYDPPGRRKQFRPYNVKTGKYEAPDLRPLYNMPGIAAAETVILCEGEKCADALIHSGYCATTAMGGANTPIDKTDWSPLRDRHVLIWPDNDEAGKSYAQRLARELPGYGVRGVGMLIPPEAKKEKWDAADAVLEGFDVPGFLETAVQDDYEFEKPALPAFSLREYIDDLSPLPPDLIAPRILTPGGLFVLAGAPKVGKSDFVLSMLIHMAAGVPFLNMAPPRPLRIFYLQAEVQYAYLKERIHNTIRHCEAAAGAADNLIVTPSSRFILNENGMREAVKTILRKFPGGPDIVCIDPIRNVFDGGPDSRGENDNNAMLFFLQERVDRLCDRVNPEAGRILVHHIKKMSKVQVKEDPFQALSGASSLRSYYHTGAVIFRENELLSERQMFFELRNGPPVDRKLIDKKDGVWIEIEQKSQRLINESYGRQLDAERDRKTETILDLIAHEAESKGLLYTANQFAESFEGTKGGHDLGSTDTIRKRLSAIATQGLIKFIRDPSDFGIAKSKSRQGYLVVENMRIRHDGKLKPVYPSHYKKQNLGSILPVENPHIWVMPDEEESS